MFAPAETAIRSYIEANYSGLTLRWSGEPIPSERDAGEAYIEVEVIGGFNSLHAFATPGNRLFIHRGLLRFYIMTPQQSRASVALVVADELAALLELKELPAPVVPQMVRTLYFSTNAGIAVDEEGNFNVLMCSISFDFYYRN